MSATDVAARKSKAAYQTPQRIGQGLYRRGATIFARITIDGRETFRSTNTDEPAVARKILKKWQAEQALKAHGIESPTAALERNRLTTGTVLDDYIAAGCPDRAMREKTPATRETEMKCIQRLRGYFGAKYAGTLTLDNCDEYRRWRADGGYIWQQCGHERRSKGGNRIVDIELQVLGNALALAARRGKLKANPLAGRQRYHREEDTTHCREKAPAPEQLENIVQTLRVRGQGSVADCIMFLALSGLRVNEALRLAWDEVDWQAGIVNVQREKRGINPWIEVHPEMRRLLRQMWARHKSQWLFPSVLDAERPLSYATVATTLARTWRSLGMGCITLHGLRSFFVTQCRESGMSDVEIAAAIGDRSGAAIIARTYGDVRPERLRKQLRDVIFVGTKGDETEAEPQSEAGSVPQRQVAA